MILLELENETKIVVDLIKIILVQKRWDRIKILCALSRIIHSHPPWRNFQSAANAPRSATDAVHPQGVKYAYFFFQITEDLR